MKCERVKKTNALLWLPPTAPLPHTTRCLKPIGLGNVKLLLRHTTHSPDMPFYPIPLPLRPYTQHT